MIKRTARLPLPVFNIKDILNRPDVYRQSISARNQKLYKSQSFDDLLTKLHELNQAEHQQTEIVKLRNQNNEQVKILTHEKQTDKIDFQKGKELKEKYQLSLNHVREVRSDAYNLLKTVPNILPPHHSTVNKTVFQSHDEVQPDKSRDHVTIGEKFKLLDISSGTSVSQQGQVFLTGYGALLQQALINYAISKCMQFKFTLVSPPSMVQKEFAYACGFQPRDEEASQIYNIENTSLCLSGTAEIPLAAQLANTRISDLPLMHAGLSRSYRAEAGARGQESRGLYRVHEFDKVEMFVWCNPTIEESEKWLEELLGFQKQILEPILTDLEIPYRVLEIAPDDLGAPAYKKYDIEAWMPGRGQWGELTSASNCLDFQSRRLNTKTVRHEYVHTLNATALAVPRVIVAILENGYIPEVGIKIPRVLQEYMKTDVIPLPASV